LEPEGAHSNKNKPRERIIPIRVEQDADESSTVSSPSPAKPPATLAQQQKLVSQRYVSQTSTCVQESLRVVMWDVLLHRDLCYKED
jgi:hypothetical protein